MNRILSLIVVMFFTIYLIPCKSSAQQKPSGRVAKIIRIKDLKCNIEIIGVVTDVNCFGDNTGGIDLTVTGTKGSVSYLWNDGSTEQNRDGLSAGTYTVMVKDETKRKSTASFTVTQPDAPLTIDPIIKQPSSDTKCDGSVVLDIAGGNPLYSISWSDGYTGSCRKGLCPGSTYRICVTDSNGCSATTKVKLTAPSNLISQSIDASTLVTKDITTVVASPNPTKGMVQLAITAKTNGTAVINIYDANGKILMNLKSNVLQGINNKTVDLTKYSKGIYHIEMLVDGQKKTTKIMLQ
ncbi:T9SS type A sorting domain-containing protein [Panacibacter ginsenosidivorans]|uniref:T9SS type A sorting domain-containing protein n=1 Tax=Panacibacter ginsenosidivorans TaxID=1813871 RepID=A0A5B8VBZ7_9BACT|nr:T9SS type A sorting domain-containing protein [Panacibacter ginsenosidivorans]QEC68206.1 T9SS type A sorting domain-containing protein [Panacibacter ginsenosidivorans]